MKICVISDTHSLNLPQKLLEELSKVDLIIHAGDICDLGLLKLLQSMKPVKAVYGNMCDAKLKAKLPLKEYFECEGVRIGIHHGHVGIKDARGNAEDQFKGQKVDIIIFGHSHHALNQKIDGVLYFNPGSPNDVVKARYFSYGMIVVHEGKYKASIIKL